MHSTKLVTEIAASLMQKSWMLAVAESCTGGLLAGALTSVSGSSKWFERGFVTYSNVSKHDLLGVPDGALTRYGAVSEEVAKKMAIGALKHSLADIAVSITGIAGPEGGSIDKPVGLVWFGLADISGQIQTAQQIFHGDRAGIREAAVSFALEMIQHVLLES